MVAIHSTWGNSLLKRVFPWAIKELLWIGRPLLKDDPTKELAALNYSRRAALEYLYKSYSRGTVWTTIFIPSELLYAMDLTPFCMEVIAAVLAGRGRGPSGLHEADSSDIPTDACSLHRLALGLALKGLFPRPVMLAGSTILCDSGVKSITLAEAITGKKPFILNVPTEPSETAVKYVAHQLQGLVKALEWATGRKMEADRLQEVVECSNRTRQRILEINDLRVHPASPLRGSSALNLMLYSHVLLGSQEGEEFYTRLAQETREKIIQSGKQRPSSRIPNPSERPTRILWLEGKPYFNSDLMSYLEDKLGVKIVFEEQNYVYWDELDPENPYEGLAKKLVYLHWNGPNERRLGVIKTLARRYCVDGIVLFSQWGCRRNNAAVPFIKREMEKEGFPFLSLDGDYVDSHNYMPGQFATRIEGFLEMLRDKKTARLH